MERITAPILRNDRDSAVHNWQDGLLLLLTFTPTEPPDPDRQVLIDKLAAEQRDDVYGDITTEAVARFQREHRTTFDLLLDTGEQVDDATAAMNRMLQKLPRRALVELSTLA